LDAKYLVAHAFNKVTSDTAKFIIVVESLTGKIMGSKSYPTGLNYYKYSKNVLVDSKMNVYIASLFNA